MSITITLYNFSKRENSTKQPTGGVEVQAVFKNATSKYNPSFILNIEDPLNYNYIKYGNIYYYVNDVILLSNDHAEYQCEVDVLATWKTDISKTKAYIEYSTSIYDISVVDTRLSTNRNATRKSTSTGILSGGQKGYIVGILLQGWNDVFYLNEVDLLVLTRALTKSAYGELFTDPANGISKLLTDTTSCLLSVKYCPKIYSYQASLPCVLVGGYNVEGISDLARCDENHEEVASISIPWQFNDYRNRSNFTSLELFLPGYGVASLNADNFIGKTKIDIKINLDSRTGELSYYIEGVFKATCNISANVPCTTTQQGNDNGIINGAVNTGIGLSTGNILQTFGGVAQSVFSSMQSNPGSFGSFGGVSAWNINPNIVLTSICHDTIVEPATMAEVQGRPYGAISNIPDNGYVQTVNASVNCNAPQFLKDKINSYLNGGMYYE